MSDQKLQPWKMLPALIGFVLLLVAMYFSAQWAVP
jgi:hypothetical protein